MALSDKQEQMCSESKWDFSDLKALFLNCTLKKSPELSHTQGLIEISIAIMEKNGVSVEMLRPVDRSIAYSLWPDRPSVGGSRTLARDLRTGTARPHTPQQYLDPGRRQGAPLRMGGRRGRRDRGRFSAGLR